MVVLPIGTTRGAYMSYEEHKFNQSLVTGKIGEKMFQAYAWNNGLQIEKTSFEVDFHDKVDYIVSSPEKNYGYDIKLDNQAALASGNFFLETVSQSKYNSGDKYKLSSYTVTSEGWATKNGSKADYIGYIIPWVTSQKVRPVIYCISHKQIAEWVEPSGIFSNKHDARARNSSYYSWGKIIDACEVQTQLDLSVDLHPYGVYDIPSPYEEYRLYPTGRTIVDEPAIGRDFQWELPEKDKKHDLRITDDREIIKEYWSSLFNQWEKQEHQFEYKSARGKSIPPKCGEATYQETFF